MTELRDKWGPAIFSLVFRREDGTFEGLGNAFSISANGDWALVATADHNIRYLDRIAVKKSPFDSLVEAKRANPDFKPQIMAILGIRKVEGKLDVVRIGEFSRVFNEAFDVALGFAKLQTTDQVPFEKRFPIKLLPPRVGENVIVVGTCNFQNTYEDNDVREDDALWKIKINNVQFTAEVVDVYLKKQGITEGPCFEIKADFPFGLSGSPVLYINSSRIKIGDFDPRA